MVELLAEFSSTPSWFYPNQFSSIYKGYYQKNTIYGEQSSSVVEYLVVSQNNKY